MKTEVVVSMSMTVESGDGFPKSESQLVPFISCVILGSSLTSLNFSFLMAKVVAEVVIIT